MNFPSLFLKGKLGIVTLSWVNSWMNFAVDPIFFLYVILYCMLIIETTTKIGARP